MKAESQEIATLNTTKLVDTLTVKKECIVIRSFSLLGHRHHNFGSFHQAKAEAGASTCTLMAWLWGHQVTNNQPPNTVNVPGNTSLAQFNPPAGHIGG